MQNQILLNERQRIAEIYMSQPLHHVCKICEQKINGEDITFISHGIEYIICGHCGHLNGAYQETAKERVEAVFLPKAKFLIETMARSISERALHK